MLNLMQFSVSVINKDNGHEIYFDMFKKTEEEVEEEVKALLKGVSYNYDVLITLV